MTLAMFDLDHTLLDGDSDGLWGEFLVAVGALDAELFRRESARYDRDYRTGQLDADAYYRFSLAPLGQHSVEQLMPGDTATSKSIFTNAWRAARGSCSRIIATQGTR